MAAVERLNLAGRAGRWSAANWKKALFGWLLLAAAAMAVGSLVGYRQMPDSRAAAGETATALNMLAQAGFVQPATENVLVQSRARTASDPHFQSTVAQVVLTLNGLKNVENVQNPLEGRDAGGQISRDGHSVLVQFTIAGDPDKAKDKIEPILAAIGTVQAVNPLVSVREVGSASAGYELDKRFEKDFARIKVLTIVVPMLILLLAFGALVAAGLPVLLAFSAVLGALGIYALVTRAISLDFQASSEVMILIGMAVGIDYSLFYLRREREERAAGQPPRAGLVRAASTSGQAVLISGATVLVAMAGMFIAGNKIFTSFAIEIGRASCRERV